MRSSPARPRLAARLAFEQLVSRYEARLYQFLRLKTADPRDAEELTQSTFITAFRKIHLYKPKHAFATWLFTIARRLTIDDYRRNQNRPLTNALPEESAINTLVEAATQPDLIAESEEHSALWISIRAIFNDHQFTAMWLKYEQDLPIAEIATAMEKTKTHVKVMLHRARQSLIAQFSATDAGGCALHHHPPVPDQTLTQPMSLCHIRQLRISSALDDERELSTSLQRHIDACPRCGRFLAESEALGDAWLSTVSGTGHPQPGCIPRIMAEIHASAPGGGQERTPAWLPVAAGIAGMAAFWLVMIAMGAPPGRACSSETASRAALGTGPASAPGFSARPHRETCKTSALRRVSEPCHRHFRREEVP